MKNGHQHIDAYPATGQQQVLHKYKFDDPSSAESPDAAPKISVLCFDVSQLTSATKFLFLTSGVMVFFICSAYSQESAFRVEGFRSFGWYFALIEFACFSMFACLEMCMKRDFKRRAPFKAYLLIAVLEVSTIGFSNASLGYLNFTTQVIFRSCRPVPTLILGVLIQGKKYTMWEYAACGLLSFGLVWFTLGDMTVQPDFNLTGIMMISISLFADSALINVQEIVIKRHNCSTMELIVNAYSLGLVIILFIEIMSGQFFSAYEFCRNHAVETYGWAIIFAACGFVGINFLLALLREFGIVVTIMVTTSRKAITIVLSFIAFSKPVTIHYLWSSLVIVAGIYLNLYSRNKSSWDSTTQQWWKGVTAKVLPASTEARKNGGNTVY